MPPEPGKPPARLAYALERAGRPGRSIWKIVRTGCHTWHMPLPLFALDPCPHCGIRNQGTRAKPGNAVRCAGCKAMRRVPSDRPTAGADDPRATRPARGRPLAPGNPTRFQPEPSAGPKPAPKQPAAPARPRPATVQPVRDRVQPPRRPAPVRAEVEPDAPGRTNADALIELMSAFLPAHLRPGVQPAAPAAVRAAAPAPAFRPALVAPVTRRPKPARAAREMPEFVPYISCDKCVEEHYRNEHGVYPGAVAQIGVWVNDKANGQAYVCTKHFVYFESLAETRADTRIHVMKKAEIQKMRPTYVNPSACGHEDIEYDPHNDVNRCRNCRTAWPVGPRVV